VALELRAPTELLPEAMAARLLLLGDGHPLRVARYGGRRGSGQTDLLVSTLAPRETPLEEVRAQLERAVRELAPFCGDALVRRATAAARWDRDDLVGAADARAPEAPAGLRLSSRPLVVSLERDAAAAHGFEGELLLGWRAGDELRAELG
jgi:hypothetical protein